MSEPAAPRPTSLRDERDAVIERLAEHFSRDRLDVDEFERRVDAAHCAATGEALVALTRDLEPIEATAAEPAATAAPTTQALARPDPRALLAHRPRRKWLLAVMSGSRRRGQWRVPESVHSLSVMGGTQLDFREAILAPGRTTVTVVCIMGGCEIIVPPGLHVECDGISIMGGFETLDRSPPVPDPDEPVLHIRGLCVMGGLDVTTRLPGEGAGDARRRRKRERRELRDQRRGGELKVGEGETRGELPPAIIHRDR